MLSIVLFLESDLRRHVGGCPAEYLQFLGVGAHHREPKVYDLNHVRLIFYEDVVKLDVPVSYILPMHVLHRLCNLLKYSPTLNLAKPLIRSGPTTTLVLNQLLERDALDILRHYVNLPARFDKFDQLDDVRVVQLLENSYLTLHSLSFHWISQFVAIIDLQGERKP